MVLCEQLAHERRDTECRRRALPGVVAEHTGIAEPDAQARIEHGQEERHRPRCVRAHVRADGSARRRQRLAEGDSRGVGRRRSIAKVARARMERAHRKRRRLAFGDSKAIVGDEVERAVDDVERTADVAKPLERHVVSRIETGECARVPVTLGTGHAQKRSHEPAAIHAVQRELVDRDDASKAGAYRKEAEEREQDPRAATRLTGCGVSWKRRRSWMNVKQQAVGVRDEHDQQDRRHRRGEPATRSRVATRHFLACDASAAISRRRRHPKPA